MRSSLLAIALLLLFTVTPAFAQIPTSVDPLTVSISPQFPRPYDTVTITPGSNLLDLAASTITVTANGTVVESGAGARSASVRLGGPGSRMTIRVTATHAGASYEKNVVVVPADVALITEANSTVPPFYDGAALVAPQGGVRLIAIADLRSSSGARIAPQNLSYTWMIEDRLLNEQSGIGRSTLVAVAPVRYRDAEVSVTVATPDGSTKARSTVTITPSNPVLQIYPTNPLLGTDYNRAVTNNFSLVADEATFEAVPYFFANPPQITWSLDSKAAGSESQLTVRTTGASAGSGAVRASAAGDGGEVAQNSFLIQFEAPKSGTIFGF